MICDIFWGDCRVDGDRSRSNEAAQGLTSDTGAAYAWDEAAAFYVGNVVSLVAQSGSFVCYLTF